MDRFTFIRRRKKEKNHDGAQILNSFSPLAKPKRSSDDLDDKELGYNSSD